MNGQISRKGKEEETRKDIIRGISNLYFTTEHQIAFLQNALVKFVSAYVDGNTAISVNSDADIMVNIATLMSEAHVDPLVLSGYEEGFFSE